MVDKAFQFLDYKGLELWIQFKKELRNKVYSVNPYKFWERGTIENTMKLISGFKISLQFSE